MWLPFACRPSVYHKRSDHRSFSGIVIVVFPSPLTASRAASGEGLNRGRSGGNRDNNDRAIGWLVNVFDETKVFPTRPLTSYCQMEAAAGDLEGGDRNIVHSSTQALSEFARSKLHLDNNSSSCLFMLSFLITPPSSFPPLPVPADTSNGLICLCFCSQALPSTQSGGCAQRVYPQ